MLAKNNSLKVVKIFFENPEKKFHIREIARLTKLSPPGVIHIVKELSKEDLLLSEKNKIVKNYYASKSEKFVQMKRMFNVFSLYESGFVSFLREAYEEPEAIVLFGSFARGEDGPKSDIDIAVVTGKRLEPDVRKFESIFKRKISIHEIRIKGADKNFLNSLANGIILYGYLKVSG